MELHVRLFVGMMCSMSSIRGLLISREDVPTREGSMTVMWMMKSEVVHGLIDSHFWKPK
jgi:flagellar biosynthesis protein FliR